MVEILSGVFEGKSQGTSIGLIIRNTSQHSKDYSNLKNTLLEIDNYVYDNNIELEVYKDKNVKEVVEQINIGKHNYCAVIFTKNKEDAYYFIKNVKAEKIFVNKKLSVEYEFELSDEDLTICKKIYI